ncbi:hypothetical protein ACFPM0_04815 [Pseudonocardia sulfidoxydans]|uniref:hypothetical protein n=1 Tax=Pseudonocardia sulfidoxydans TaxID=54011 RepID=UPI003621F1DB
MTTPRATSPSSRMPEHSSQVARGSSAAPCSPRCATALRLRAKNRPQPHCPPRAATQQLGCAQRTGRNPTAPHRPQHSSQVAHNAPAATPLLPTGRNTAARLRADSGQES